MSRTSIKKNAGVWLTCLLSLLSIALLLGQEYIQAYANPNTPKIGAGIGITVLPAVLDVGSPFLSNTLTGTITVTKKSSGGGGGGGGGAAQKPTTIKSPDELFVLSIPYGSEIRSVKGTWLSVSEVSIDDSTIKPTLPDGYTFISSVYSFLPDGLTLTPRSTLVYQYYPDELPLGIVEADLVIAFYDSEAEEWVILRSVVDMDDCTITARVSHFTRFAAMVPSPAPTVTTPVEPDEPEATVTPPSTTTTAQPAGTPAATPAKTPATPTTKKGIPWWVAPIILGSLLLVFVVIKVSKSGHGENEDDDDEIRWDDDEDSDDD